MNGFVTMVRHQLRANRMSMTVMTVLMAFFTATQFIAFTVAFPATGGVIQISTITESTALRALYGMPYNPDTVAGWTAWRAMSSAAIIIAAWAVIVTVGALRGEEESGRAELALSQPQPRHRWFRAALTAITLETLLIGAVTFVATVFAGVPEGLATMSQCLVLTLQLIMPALLFIGVGAVVSQLIATTRAARIAGLGVLGIAFLVRIPADTVSGWEWVRRLTPLGWDEEMRPVRDFSWPALLALAVSAAVLIAVSLPMLRRRDVGLGILRRHDSRPPRLWLLRSPWQAALREDFPQLVVWFVAAVSVAALMGSLVSTVLDFLKSTPDVARFIGQGFAIDAFFGSIFSIFQLVGVLLVITLMVSARGEEASGRLEILMATPRSRIGWLAGRAVLAALAAFVVILACSVAMWAAAVSTGIDVAAWPLIEAALNCIPLLILAAGFAMAFVAIAPRVVGLLYAVAVSLYLWEAIGTMLKAPAWALDISPFHALAVVPLQDFAWLPAVTLAVIGAAFAVTGSALFRDRDLAAG